MDNAEVDFFNRLIASEKKLTVTEVGIGIPVTNALTLIPGASKVLQAAWAPYNREFNISKAGNWTLPKSRTVSEDYCRYWVQAWKTSYPEFEYGFGSTGMHGDNTHAWACVLGPDVDFWTIHYTIQSPITRAAAAEAALTINRWFMERALLKDRPWDDYRDDPGVSPYVKVDVLNGPGISLETKVQLATGPSICIFPFEGAPSSYRMVRAADFIREHVAFNDKKVLRLLRGSFNPPHLGHRAALGDRGIYEICGNNLLKGVVNPIDLAHRVRMLHAIGGTVMLTDYPFFAILHARLKELDRNLEHIIYPVGTDTMDEIANDDPQRCQALKDTGAEFEVRSRYFGQGVSNKAYARELRFRFADNNEYQDMSSSAIRDDLLENVEHIDPRVLQYIISNKLYRKKKGASCVS